ncbi:MAG: hexose kinase [Gemmatimonadetes bacterium]|nr:hexose kinase [Gemmatimonadota bacterium]
MILTLTPNPSLDVLFEAERVVWDDANRVEAPRRRPGGQGINLARAARVLGGRALALAPLGGRTGRELADQLAREGTPLRSVTIAGETRLFVGVREGVSGRSLLLNPRGPTLALDETRALLGALRELLAGERPKWLACCGSLPPGVPADFYARAGSLAREHGVRFVPDCDGDALRLAAAGGCDLLVPNTHEAARLLGRPTEGAAAAEAAPALLGFGAGLGVIKLGEDGAVAATPEGAVWHAVAPLVRQGSAVGAGDAFLAALLLAHENGAEAAETLRAAVAAGTAVLLSRGSDILTQDDVEAVKREVKVVKLS